MSDVISNLTPAESQLLEAFRASDFDTLVELLGALAKSNTPQSVVLERSVKPAKQPKGELDQFWQDGTGGDDIDIWKQPLNTMVGYVFALLVSGGYIPSYTLYSRDNLTSALLKDIRLGVIMDIRETSIQRLVQLKKLITLCRKCHGEVEFGKRPCPIPKAS